MTLRFKRTIDESPYMFSTRELADNDWLLYCGDWQVGRVHPNLTPAGRVSFVWSLTGPHTPEAVVALRGEGQTAAHAMRGWAYGPACGSPTAAGGSCRGGFSRGTVARISPAMQQTDALGAVAGRRSF